MTAVSPSFEWSGKSRTCTVDGAGRSAPPPVQVHARSKNVMRALPVSSVPPPPLLLLLLGTAQPVRPVLDLEQVTALRDPSPATFKAQCLSSALPCLLPPTLTPATPNDTMHWSRDGLLSRHAETFVVLGTNRSLAVRGRPSPREPVRLGDYLGQRQRQRQQQQQQEQDCADSAHAGYLFLSAGNERSHGALLDDAGEAATRWSRGALADFIGDMEPTEPVISVSASENAGIPWHRHHAAWLLLLHGSKRWHLYPPSVHPPGMILHGPISSDLEGEDSSSGHAAWVHSVLPSLSTGERPLEVVQRSGEILYVPEGWQVTLAL